MIVMKWQQQKNRIGKKNPNWKGGISLNRKEYEKAYWNKPENRVRKKGAIKVCQGKNREKYHKKRQKRYKTKEFKLVQTRSALKRKQGDYPILVTKKELKKLIRMSKNCYYCGVELNNKFEIDHKTPIRRGGKSIITNLAVACQRCNRSKGAKTAEEFIALNTSS